MKKLLIFSLITAMLFTVFQLGCEKNIKKEQKVLDYNAKCLADIVLDFVDERRNVIVYGSFLKENITNGAIYYNVDYDYQVSGSQKYLYCETGENEKIIVIDNESDYEKVLLYPEKTDFSKEMIIVYISTYYSDDSEDIEQVALKEKTLEIKLIEDEEGAYSFAKPRLRCFIIKLEKLDVSEIKFIHV